MSDSEINTPASTATTATEEKNVSNQAEVVRKYKTKELIEFLRKKVDLELGERVFEILEKEKINGRDFLKITKEELRSCGMAGGPATRLADFAKELGKRKLKSFSSYESKKDLKEVLAKYGVEDGRITDIPQFTPKSHNIDDENEALVHCLKIIRLRIRNMGPVVESNEAIRYEYISVILHACINIVRELTGKKISLNPQFEVDDEENTCHVDYAIKALEELVCITEGKPYQIAIGFAQNVIKCESAFQTNKRERKIQCESALQTNKRKRKTDDAFGEEYDYLIGIVTTATEWHFLLYTPDGISCTSRNPLNIRFVETSLEEGSEDEKELCKNVKRVMEVIVGLLRERVDVEKEPKNKKARVQEYLKKE